MDVAGSLQEGLECGQGGKAWLGSWLGEQWVHNTGLGWAGLVSGAWHLAVVERVCVCRYACVWCVYVGTYRRSPIRPKTSNNCPGYLPYL